MIYEPLSSRFATDDVSTGGAKRNGSSFSLKKNLIPLLIVLIILAGIALRFLYLAADPPTDLTISGGILGDPGLYSYAARNMVLFDKTGFAGYEPIAGSPFMTYVNYLAYKLFGINFYTQRAIPLLFSVLSLILFCFIIYRYFGKYICLFSAIFLAFNYPLLMYSRCGNRQFPMLFFFLVSLFFFIKGAENKKNSFFFWSALFFIVSYLSKGTILFLVPLYLIVGLIWLIEKRVKFRNLLTFFISLSFFLLLWALFIYLPYKHLLDSLIAHNRAAGNIISLSALVHDILHRPLLILRNIFNSPFMLQFKSDPVLLLVTLFGVFVYLYQRIKKKTGNPYLLDIAFFWLLIIVAKNALFSYRPVRHYLDLVFPAALLAGWLLKRLIDSDIKIKPDWTLAFVLAFALLLLLPFGIVNYFNRFFAKSFLHQPIFTILFLAILLSILLILLFRQKGAYRVLFLVFVLLCSIYGNLSFFSRWAKERTYQVVHIADVFGKAIPPAYVAGNWASLLAAGTPHKTTLAWPGQVNWQPDFLKKNKIQYVMISDFSPDGYLAFRRMFKKDLDNAALLAIFSLHKKNLYLFKLVEDTRPRRLEAEAFYRDKVAAQVIYDKELSNRMGVALVPLPAVRARYILEKEFKTEEAGLYTFAIKTKGSYLLDAAISLDGRTIAAEKLIVRQKETGIKTFQARLPGAEKLRISLTVYRLRDSVTIDFIEYNRADVHYTPSAVTDNLGSRREYRLFLPPGYAKGAKLPLLVYFHAVMSPEFKDRVPTLKHYTGSPVEETGLIELGQKHNFILLVPSALYEFPSVGNCTAKGWLIDKELDGIEKIIDTVVENHSVSRDRVYLAGISSGAIMCHYLANHRPLFYGAILSHSQGYTHKDGKGGVLEPTVKGARFGVLFVYNQGDYPELIEFCRTSHQIYKRFGYKTMLLENVPPRGHAWSKPSNEEFWHLLQKLSPKK